MSFTRHSAIWDKGDLPLTPDGVHADTEVKSGFELLLQHMNAEQFCKNYRDEETKEPASASRCSHSMMQQQQPQPRSSSIRSY